MPTNATSLFLQARKLAVEVCDVLFSRSKCFRRVLAGQFSQFVELTVGHKPDKPLPPPAAAAVALREKALEAVEKWHEAWGLHYPQVRFLASRAAGFSVLCKFVHMFSFADMWWSQRTHLLFWWFLAVPGGLKSFSCSFACLPRSVARYRGCSGELVCVWCVLQVTAAYKYLKKQYKFPEISSRAAAAAAAEAERQRRHQQLLLSRYEQLNQQWPQQQQQLDGLLHQMRECFELLQQPVPEQPLQELDMPAGAADEEQVHQQMHQQRIEVAQEGLRSASQSTNAQTATAAAVPLPAAAGVQGAPDDDQEWEDVAGQQQQQAAGDADFDMDELVGDFQEPT
jgi:hypothetical protein